ncbi:MAG TPA: site-specific DNA-methyltransferase [Polyangiaceae bacterium]|nr:site-specific DNA-methyltransferase [Polyangiaceae bacterium]
MRGDFCTVRLSWAGKREPTAAGAAEALDLAVEKTGDQGFELVSGDNLRALRALARRPQRFALAYLDPPFLTGREHAEVGRRRNEKGEIVRTLTPAFDDRWDSLEAYLNALGERLVAARELLRDDGCLVLHVDPKTSHYAKVLCDEIFGPRSFASEIVWRYRRWPAKTKNFQRVHDVLLRYVKNPDISPRFRQLYEPLAASTLATWGDKKQRAVVDDAGRRRCSSRTPEKTAGAPMGDVWEISIVAPVAKERTGYPTQKPEALLQRLIEACSEPGDAILDPYLGSGTTLSVAARLGRVGTGIDANPRALHIARQRLAAMSIACAEASVNRPAAPRAAARPGRKLRVA